MKTRCPAWCDRILFSQEAKELIFNEITTGASGDISQATDLARRMVCEWGMSDKLGPLSYGKKDQAIFLGKEFGHHKDYSEQTANMIDQEIRAIVDSELERSRKLLRENREKLESLAGALLEFETLDSEQVDILLTGGKLVPVVEEEAKA